jgi:hypothetical protein
VLDEITGKSSTETHHFLLTLSISFFHINSVWPDLSMLSYQKAAPQLKAICEKYGVPYVQESVFTRLRKTVDIMVGKTSMRPFPTQYEPSRDKAVKELSWKSTNGAIDE